MNSVRRSLAGILFAWTCFNSLAEPVNYTVDPAHTFPQFEISHLGFSVHRGRFNRTQGTLTLDLTQKQGVIKISIEAASIDTGDEALEKILRSDAFFDVEHHPVMTFQSNRFDFSAEQLTAVHGTLMIKGIERPISLIVDHVHCGRQLLQPRPVCGANATARLLRSDFDLDKYVRFGLGDEVTLRIQIEAIADATDPPANP